MGATELYLAIDGTKHWLIILNGFNAGFAMMGGVALIIHRMANR